MHTYNSLIRGSPPAPPHCLSWGHRSGSTPCYVYFYNECVTGVPPCLGDWPVDHRLEWGLWSHQSLIIQPSIRAPFVISCKIAYHFILISLCSDVHLPGGHLYTVLMKCFWEYKLQTMNYNNIILAYQKYRVILTRYHILYCAIYFLHTDIHKVIANSSSEVQIKHQRSQSEKWSCPSCVSILKTFICCFSPGCYFCTVNFPWHHGHPHH